MYVWQVLDAASETHPSFSRMSPLKRNPSTGEALTDLNIGMMITVAARKVRKSSPRGTSDSSRALAAFSSTDLWRCRRDCCAGLRACQPCCEHGHLCRTGQLLTELSGEVKEHLPPSAALQQTDGRDLCWSAGLLVCLWYADGRCLWQSCCKDPGQPDKKSVCDNVPRFWAPTNPQLSFTGADISSIEL